MKVLSFGALEILPALLNETKTQTIRPAWGKYADIGNHVFFTGPASKKCIEEAKTDSRYNREECLKKPRFKPGDEIRLEWKSRNSPKGSWFCSKCGKEAIITPKELPYQHLYVKVKSPKGGLDNHARRTQPEAQRR